MCADSGRSPASGAGGHPAGKRRRRNDPAHAHAWAGSSRSRVELWGFEPQTSSMPWRRATNCAIAPCAVRRRFEFIGRGGVG